MAYQTGSASDHHDLLDKLRTFLSSNGWTVNLWAVDGDGYRLHIQNGSQYVNFRSTETNPANPAYTNNENAHIWINGSEGFDSGEAWDAQPNASPSSILRDCPGPLVAYHFFLDGDACYVVVEKTTGIFLHMAFGLLIKAGLGAGQSGAFIGSVYFQPSVTGPSFSNASVLFDCNQTSSPYKNYLRVDIDGATGSWIPFTNSVSVDPRVIGVCRDKGAIYDLVLSQPNTFNQSTVFIPLWCMASRASGYYSIIGYPPNIAQVSLALYSGGDTITIGSDTWMVFPWYQRGHVFSVLRGYAYKKVV